MRAAEGDAGKRELEVEKCGGRKETERKTDGDLRGHTDTRLSGLYSRQSTLKRSKSLAMNCRRNAMPQPTTHIY